MDLLLILAAVAGLVWIGVYCLRGSLAIGGLCAVLTAAVVGFDFWHADFGPTALTIDRIIVALLVIACFIQWRMGQTARLRLYWVDYALLAFLALAGISLFCGTFATPRLQSVSVWRFTVAYVTPATLYFIVRQSPLNERTLSIIRGAFTLLGVYLGLTGICEITKTWALVFPWQIADPRIGEHFGRARGPMVHSVSYGLCLALCLLAAWAWRVHLSLRWQRAILLSVPIFLAGIFFSLTRSVWIGAAAGIAIMLGITLAGAQRRAFLAVTIATLILLVIVQPESMMSFERERSAENTAQSAELRASFAYVSWNMFLDKPLFGCGFGQFFTAKLPYLADRQTDLLLEPIRGWVHHNTFLSVLTEMGAVGFVLFLAILGGWGYEGWRLWRCQNAPRWARVQGALGLAVLGVYIPQLLFHELSYGVLNNSLVFFFASLTLGLRTHVDVSPQVRSESQRDVAASPRAVTAAV